MDQVIAVWRTDLAPRRDVRQAVSHELKEKAMATYRIVYGADEQVVRETFNHVELQRQDGWPVVFGDNDANDAILPVREEHVQSVQAFDERT